MAFGEQSSQGRRTWVRGVVAAALGVSAVLTMSGAATAEPASGALTDSQAQVRGLSAAEATTLQNRVDSYVARLGGTQIAPDRVQLAEGVVLKVALPTTTGGGSSPRTAAYDCRYKHFCAYSDTYFTGDVIDMIACASYKIPWFGDGSWQNHQTAGTRAQFRDNQFIVRWTDSGAPTQDEVADWSWVHYVTNC